MMENQRFTPLEKNLLILLFIITFIISLCLTDRVLNYVNPIHSFNNLSLNAPLDFEGESKINCELIPLSESRRLFGLHNKNIIVRQDFITCDINYILPFYDFSEIIVVLKDENGNIINSAMASSKEVNVIIEKINLEINSSKYVTIEIIEQRISYPIGYDINKKINYGDKTQIIPSTNMVRRVYAGKYYVYESYDAYLEIEQEWKANRITLGSALFIGLWSGMLGILSFIKELIR